MRQAVRLVSALVLVVGCRGDDHSTRSGEITKLAPLAVSDENAWALFDRSVSSAYRPDAPIEVNLGDEAIAAVKVHGPAPYRITLRGATGSTLGFDTIDLGDISPGWHTFWSTHPQTARSRVFVSKAA